MRILKQQNAIIRLKQQVVCFNLCVIKGLTLEKLLSTNLNTYFPEPDRHYQTSPDKPDKHVCRLRRQPEPLRLHTVLLHNRDILPHNRTHWHPATPHQNDTRITTDSVGCAAGTRAQREREPNAA